MEEADKLEQFIVNLPYGEMTPRLISNVALPKKYSTLIASTVHEDGYADRQ